MDSSLGRASEIYHFAMLWLELYVKLWLEWMKESTRASETKSRCRLWKYPKRSKKTPSRQGSEGSYLGRGLISLALPRE
jgi:hypothetical protein